MKIRGKKVSTDISEEKGSAAFKDDPRIVFLWESQLNPLFQ